MNNLPAFSSHAPQYLNVSDQASLAVNWKQWRRQWKHFHISSRLREQPEEIQVATLLSSLGPEALNVLDGLCPNDEDQQCLTAILDKLEEFCVGETNETFERYKFNVRNQETGESIDTYVAELRRMVKPCNYGGLEEGLLRDRIVLGITDDAVRRRLLQTPKLTLTQAVTAVKAHEATARQMSSITSHNSSEVQTVRQRQKYGPSHGVRQQTRAPPSQRACKFCGKRHEFRKEMCPAWGKQCQACGSKNHFAIKCPRAEVRLIGEYVSPYENTTPQYEEESEPGYRSYPVQPDHTSSRTPVLTLEVGAVSDRERGKLFAQLLLGENHLQRFQLDTGATVNIIPQHVYKKACRDPNLRKLKPCETALVMFNKTTTKVVGSTSIEVVNTKNMKSYEVEFLVVQQDFVPLIGSTTLQEMQLIRVLFENIASLATDEPEVPNQTRSNMAKQNIADEFKDVFSGTGKFPGQLHIQTDASVPPVQLAPRAVPEALKDEVKTELDRLTEENIITPVSEPTDWISAMLAVRKANNSIRICIDPKPLNKAVKRNHYPLPTIEDLMPELSKAKVFTVCDAKSGYWHVELDEDSSYLTTFATPWGRYRWLRLPFGICNASEEFQRRLNLALEGLQGVRAIADDILVYGVGDSHADAIKDHDEKLLYLLQRCREAGLRLNLEKMKLRQTEVKYMGHVFTHEGLKADPDKIRAIQNMPAPVDRQGVQRILGLVNYLQRFSPNLAEVSAPLRELLKKETHFLFEENVHGRALAEIKDMITRSPVLKYYNVHEDVVLQVDASQHGLGACLMQSGQPVAYASRALTETEKHYAQIEKEMLAIVYGLNKFERYILGKQVVVESDHKPLENILQKDLVSAPKRLQRMMLQLQKFDVSVIYKKGQLMYLADTLSRAHEDGTEAEEHNDEHVCITAEAASDDELDVRQVNLLEYLPVSDQLAQMAKQATAEDPKMKILEHMIRNGWPRNKNDVPDAVRMYYQFKDELSMKDGLIFKGERLLIPDKIRGDLKERIHSAHIGLQGCLRRAREAVYWPGMNQEVEDYVSKCRTCMAYRPKQQKETLRPHEIPERPWQIIACDLMDFQGHAYLVTVDVYSDFIECDRLTGKKADEIIRLLKIQMSRHGIPNKLMSDCGPPFSSREFANFARMYEFNHVTSSPGFAQSNGKAESAVKVLKNLMIKAQADNRDPYLALLDWRNTPTEGVGSSPAQRLFGRRTRTLLPTSSRLLAPEVPKNVPAKLQERQNKQLTYYNRSARDLPALQRGDAVFMAPAPGQKRWRPAVVGECLGNRSYQVKAEEGGGIYRRNRRHLQRYPGAFIEAPTSVPAPQDDYVYIPQSGETAPRPPVATPPRTQARSPYPLRNRLAEK